jgi:glycerophosphoryl diester phosphodiesterase
MTRHKNLIVIHDDTLDRTSNAEALFPDRKPWLVKDFTLEEIQKLDFGSWFNEADPFGQIAAGNVSTEDQKSYVGERAPTLREALEFTKKNQWTVNVEIKVIPSLVKEIEMMEKIVDLIEELKMEEEVIVSSFHHRYIKWAKKLNGTIATGVLVNEPLADSVKYLDMIGADAYHPKASAINLEEIGFLRDQGFGVNVWTVNDEKLMMKLIDAGVSGIITDFPEKLQTILQERSLRRK